LRNRVIVAVSIYKEKIDFRDEHSRSVQIKINQRGRLEVKPTSFEKQRRWLVTRIIGLKFRKFRKMKDVYM